MKTKRDKIYFCLLLIAAIVVSIGITTLFGSTKTILTDADMSGLYGGSGPCQYVASDATACDPSSDKGSCTPHSSCDQIIKGSCWQTEYFCADSMGSGGCTDEDPTDCKYSYRLDECTTGIPPNCEWIPPTWPSCEGTKKHATFGYSP